MAPKTEQANWPRIYALGHQSIKRIAMNFDQYPLKGNFGGIRKTAFTYIYTLLNHNSRFERMIDAVLIPDFAWKTVSKRSERFRVPFARLGPPADRKLWLFYSNFPRAFPWSDNGNESLKLFWWNPTADLWKILKASREMGCRGNCGSFMFLAVRKSLKKSAQVE